MYWKTVNIFLLFLRQYLGKKGNVIISTRMHLQLDDNNDDDDDGGSSH